MGANRQHQWSVCLLLNLRDRFLAWDPDLSRLLQGGRCALSAALSFGVVALASQRVAQPLSLGLVAGSMGMLTASLVTDADPRAQRLTLLLVAVPACGCFALSTWLAAYHWPSLGVFVVVIFLGVLARRFGARGQALGTAAFDAYFYALFYRPTAQELPWMLVAIAVATGATFGVRFGLLADAPARSTRWALRGLRAQASWLLVRLEEALRAGWTGRPRTRLRNTLGAWDDSVLTLDDQLSLQPGSAQARDALFQLEVRMARLIVAMRSAAMDAHQKSRREPLATQLEAARPALREGRLHDCAPPELQALLEGGHALVSLPLDPPARLPDPPAAASKGATPEPASPGLRPSTRQAIQVGIAAAVAMSLGHLLSPTRWIWAVVATFVVFTRTTTRGETLLKAWQRVLGTLAGVAGGLLLTELIRGHREVELTALFLFIFLAYYLLRATYTGMVLSLTVAISLLYVLLGRFTPGLMLLRLGETLLGATVAGLTAAFVLPRRTTPEVLSTLASLLRATADLLTTLARPETKRPLDAAALRPLGVRLRAFRTAAQPWLQSWGARRTGVSRQLQSAAGVVFWARDLARDDSPVTAPETLQQLAGIALRLAQTFEGGKAATDTKEVEKALEHLPPGALQQLEESLAGL